MRALLASCLLLTRAAATQQVEGVVTDTGLGARPEIDFETLGF